MDKIHIFCFNALFYFSVALHQHRQLAFPVQQGGSKSFCVGNASGQANALSHSNKVDRPRTLNVPNIAVTGAPVATVPGTYGTAIQIQPLNLSQFRPQFSATSLLTHQNHPHPAQLSINPAHTLIHSPALAQAHVHPTHATAQRTNHPAAAVAAQAIFQQFQRQAYSSTASPNGKFYYLMTLLKFILLRLTRSLNSSKPEILLK